MRDWTKEFPFSPRQLVVHDDMDGILDRRAWCNENIGTQDEEWCLIHTVYRGSRQFRFRNVGGLVLYTMVWE